jgi:zinc transport system permease protein
MIEALGLPFFQRVLVAGLLASLACGVIGSYVVARRMTSLSGSLSHAAFGGVGLGYWLGFPPLIGAAGFAIGAGVLAGLAQRRLRAGLDPVISMLWSIGMALGMVFVALAPGYAPDLMTYLFGSLLFVPWDYVALVAGLDVLILGAVWRYHTAIQAVCFDEDFAEASGVPVERVFLGLLALTALSVVTLIRVVGVILAIALLTIPASTARQWVDGMGAMMALGVAVCGASVTGGLLLSYALAEQAGVSIPPGPLIVLLAAFVFAVSSVLSRSRRAA